MFSDLVASLYYLQQNCSLTEQLRLMVGAQMDPVVDTLADHLIDKLTDQVAYCSLKDRVVVRPMDLVVYNWMGPKVDMEPGPEEV